MKLHRNLVAQTVSALHSIFHEQRQADKVIEQTLHEHPRWGARDRRQFAEACYELVRYWRRYWALADYPDERHLDRSALTHERLWKVWAAWWRAQGQALPDWLEIPALPEPTPVLTQRAVIESIPDWLDQLGEERFAERWPTLLHALNQPAAVYLRCNTLKISRDQLIERLQSENIPCKAVVGLEHALELSERRNVFSSAAFRAGLFEVQDAASQLVAPFLQLAPGQRIIDACAGAGGKSLHLATLLGDRGRILALDIHAWKLEELRRRARRNGISCIETRANESSKTIKRLRESADRVLLDVPCSGLGVLRRNPDRKWKISAEELQRLVALQQDILQRYSNMTRPGGLLLYATCSILPEENQQQVERFLAEHPQQWVLEEQRHVYPDVEGWDGFYMARLRRLE